ncbi:Protein arg-6 [Hortaea werneckii]|nr:Protein arg-6 [Hortaea werneckii]
MNPPFSASLHLRSAALVRTCSTQQIMASWRRTTCGHASRPLLSRVVAVLISYGDKNVPSELLLKGDAFVLSIAKCEVHVLQALSSRALQQVVNGDIDNRALPTAVHSKATNLHSVLAGNVLDERALAAYCHKLLAVVPVLVQLTDVSAHHLLRQRQRDRVVNALEPDCDVRDERYVLAKLRGNFALVDVVSERVGDEIRQSSPTRRRRLAVLAEEPSAGSKVRYQAVPRSRSNQGWRCGWQMRFSLSAPAPEGRMSSSTSLCPLSSIASTNGLHTPFGRAMTQQSISLFSAIFLTSSASVQQAHGKRRGRGRTPMKVAEVTEDLAGRALVGSAGSDSLSSSGSTVQLALKVDIAKHLPSVLHELGHETSPRLAMEPSAFSENQVRFSSSCLTVHASLGKSRFRFWKTLSAMLESHAERLMRFQVAVHDGRAIKALAVADKRLLQLRHVLELGQGRSLLQLGATANERTGTGVSEQLTLQRLRMDDGHAGAARQVVEQSLDVPNLAPRAVDDPWLLHVFVILLVQVNGLDQLAGFLVVDTALLRQVHNLQRNKCPSELSGSLVGVHVEHLTVFALGHAGQNGNVAIGDGRLQAGRSAMSTPLVLLQEELAGHTQGLAVSDTNALLILRLHAGLLEQLVQLRAGAVDDNWVETHLSVRMAPPTLMTANCWLLTEDVDYGGASGAIVVAGGREFATVLLLLLLLLLGGSGTGSSGGRGRSQGGGGGLSLANLLAGLASQLPGQRPTDGLHHVKGRGARQRCMSLGMCVGVCV